MSEQRRDHTTKRLLVWMIILSVGVGVVFPVFASFFVRPKSTVAEVIFVVMYILAGLLLGLVCNVITIRATQSSMRSVFRLAGEKLGVSARETVGTRQQCTASDQVVASMKDISLVSQSAAETSRKISSAIEDLSRVADSLQIG